ncbi:MAG: hypothetical protein ACE5F9_01875 [Phycisphaerae bacterium]
MKTLWTPAAPTIRRPMRPCQTAAAVCLLAVCSHASARTGPTATQPAAELAPPSEILLLLRSDDPERHIEGFAAWRRWRAGLDSDQKRSAERYLGRPRWLTALGNEVLYDMTSAKRRRTAYTLLNHIGGQRVFPYFLWGLDDNAAGSLLASLFGSGDPGIYIRRFLKRHGDPTVLAHLPEWRWHDVKDEINKRWLNRDPPDQTWEPIDADGFFDALTGLHAARRRLAIRAIAINRRIPRDRMCDAYRSLLLDSDKSVIETAVEALATISCPRARGRLKTLAADGTLPLRIRKRCLEAIVNCRTAPGWTAQWMIDNLTDWPAGLDETVQRCLVRLCPAHARAADRYRRVLRKAIEDTPDERIRLIVGGAIRDP